MKNIEKNEETFRRWMCLVKVAASRKKYPFSVLENVPYDIKFMHFQANMRPDEFVSSRIKYAIHALLLAYREKYIENHSEWGASFEEEDGFVQVALEYGGSQKIQREEILYAHNILANTIIKKD